MYHVNIAIDQEKRLSQLVEDMADQLGSNIGKFIELLRHDPRAAIRNKA